MRQLSFKRHRFLPDIISHAIWLYARFTLSFRDVSRAMVAAWVEDYNTERPHSAFGYQTPAAFAGKLTTATDRHAAPSESYARRSLAPPAP